MNKMVKIIETRDEIDFRLEGVQEMLTCDFILQFHTVSISSIQVTPLETFPQTLASRI